MIALYLSNALKTDLITEIALTCAPIPELPSNISAMGKNEKGRCLCYVFETEYFLHSATPERETISVPGRGRERERERERARETEKQRE